MVDRTVKYIHADHVALVANQVTDNFVYHSWRLKRRKTRQIDAPRATAVAKSSGAPHNQVERSFRIRIEVALCVGHILDPAA